MRAGSVRLVKPSMVYRETYLDFYKDWKASGEVIIPWVTGWDPSDFQAFLDKLYAADDEAKAAQSSPGYVPHSTYWLVNEEEKVVGSVNIRHRLNERLLAQGGHIGYGIGPSHRGKGYGAIQLRLALQLLREMGQDRALLVCESGNAGSERTIRGQGGVLESEVDTEDGQKLRRFWIAL